MKCSYCEKELEQKKGKYICPECQRVYTEQEIQDLKSIEAIEEDLKVWKEFRKFH